MRGSRSHGSGIIIIMAWGREWPVMYKYSRQLSNMDESLPVASTTGNTFSISGKNSDFDLLSRALSQLILPWIVLISPLWTM